MIFISHRANIYGPDETRENNPSSIQEVLKLNYNVEIDVRFIDGKFYLGHDTPDYLINLSFLENNMLWCHAKDIKTMEELIKYESIHSFFHQNDDITLTSKKYLWTYPGKEITKLSIAVMPESINDWHFGLAAGVCSDYIVSYKKL